MINDTGAGVGNCKLQMDHDRWQLSDPMPSRSADLQSSIVNSQFAIPLLCLCALIVLSGCEIFGYVAQGVAPKQGAVLVKAEYHGLENQKVAVLVDANQQLLFEQPLAQLEVGDAMSRKLAGNVPGITVVDARQVVDFQNRNIYWTTVPYSQIAQRLGVTRLVLIELTDYRLHEPGNVNIWRGVISGNIAVAEADGGRPDDLTYDTTVSVAYPPDQPLGVLKSDQRTMRLATLDLFSRAAAGKFHDHQEAPSE